MLRNALIRWFVNAVALAAAELIVAGISFNQPSDLIIAAAIFGILNMIIKPILVIFTLPINILSLGLFTFIINACMLGLTASFLTGFNIQGFWSALAGSIIISIVSIILNQLLKEDKQH